VTTFHTSDEVDVRNTDGTWDHGIVHDVCAFCVWVSLDRVVLDVPMHPDDPRIRMHEVAS
jgi:hypothetical protein